MKIWFCVCVHVQELLFFLYEYLLYELINYLFPQYNFFFLKVKPVHLIGDIYGEGNGNPLQYSCRKMPWMEEPGELQSMGLWRVGHDWAISLSLLIRTRLSDFTLTFHFHAWRRRWQPTPVFLPGESQGQGSLVGCRLWGCTELDTTEVTWRQQQQQHVEYYLSEIWLYNKIINGNIYDFKHRWVYSNL